VLLDCIDQVSAKAALARALSAQPPLRWLPAAAAGGRIDPTRIRRRRSGLARRRHGDPLLAKVRYRLRRHYGFRAASAPGRFDTFSVFAAVFFFSDEPVLAPTGNQQLPGRAWKQRWACAGHMDPAWSSPRRLDFARGRWAALQWVGAGRRQVDRRLLGTRGGEALRENCISVVRGGACGKRVTTTRRAARWISDCSDLLKTLPEKRAMPFRDRIATLSLRVPSRSSLFLDSERGPSRHSEPPCLCPPQKAKVTTLPGATPLRPPQWQAGTRAGTRCEGLRRRAFRERDNCVRPDVETSSRP